jgi:hypothetical protein
MSCLACCLRLLCKKSTSSTVDGVSCLLRSWITYPAAEKWGERRRKWHDRRAHSCETVASVLDEHVETVGIDENHNKMWHWIWNRTLLFLHLLSKYVLVLLKKMRKSHWHLIMVCAPNISGCSPKMFSWRPQCSYWKMLVWSPAVCYHLHHQNSVLSTFYTINILCVTIDTLCFTIETLCVTIDILGHILRV